MWRVCPGVETGTGTCKYLPRRDTSGTFYLACTCKSTTRPLTMGRGEKGKKKTATVGGVTWPSLPSRHPTSPPCQPSKQYFTAVFFWLFAVTIVVVVVVHFFIVVITHPTSGRKGRDSTRLRSTRNGCLSQQTTAVRSGLVWANLANLANICHLHSHPFVHSWAGNPDGLRSTGSVWYGVTTTATTITATTAPTRGRRNTIGNPRCTSVGPDITAEEGSPMSRLMGPSTSTSTDVFLRLPGCRAAGETTGGAVFVGLFVTGCLVAIRTTVDHDRGQIHGKFSTRAATVGTTTWRRAGLHQWPGSPAA